MIAENSPSLDVLAATLRKVTETLAGAITVPGTVAPAWNDFEWRIATAVAAMQGISSQLLSVSSWHGPAEWRLFLESQRNHIAGRHRKIEELLGILDAQARRDGVPLMALKGAALHACGVYQPGERPMADIDLLAGAGDLDAARRVLEQCGYENTFSSWRDHLFEPRIKLRPASFGEHVDNPIKIELHTRIRERLPVAETEITDLLFPAAAQPGINSYRSAGALMTHLLLHAAGNMRSRALRMIQLHDIARLARRLDDSDWREIQAAGSAGRAPWWSMPPLILTARYYAGAIPSFIFDSMEQSCHRRLVSAARRQTISDVSWSNIRVEALPGIEWSRSSREVLKYLYRRLMPSAETRLELKRFSTFHARGSEIPWYNISQPARIWRWVFSRPPRVQTLLSVQAVLSSHGAESRNALD